MVLYRFIKYLILNIKYTRLLKEIYKNEQIIPKFSQLFGTEFRIDWVGRLYTVINPNIVDDKLDLNTQFFEYGENGLSNTITPPSLAKSSTQVILKLAIMYTRC